MRRRAAAGAALAVVVPAVAVLALATGGALGAGTAPAATPPPTSTATVERRTLHATTQVDGTLGYADTYTIANQVLTATADPAAAAQAFAQAQSQYDAAVSARDALDHPPTAQLAQAQAQLAQAVASLGQTAAAAAGPTPQQVAQARAALAQAQSQLAQAQQQAAGASPAQLAQAQSQLAQAQAQLVAAQNAAAGPSAAALAQAQAAVTSASVQLANDQAAVAAAQNALSSCLRAQPTPSASGSPPAPAPSCDVQALALAVQQAQGRVTTDQAQLAAAQAALASLSSPDAQAQEQANLASAEAAVQSAQAQLAALTSGTSPEVAAQLASTQAGAQAAQAALDALLHGDAAQARRQLEAAQAQVAAAQAAIQGLLHPTAAQRKAASDAVATASAQLDAARSATGRPRGVVTQEAAVGSIVRAGGILYTLDGTHPVVLLEGTIPAWRALRAGIPDGPDVRELEADLRALGFGAAALKVDDHWDAQTTAAVKRWQRALGATQTGAVELGAVVFQPGPVRVTGAGVALGATVGPGTAVLQATSTRRVVSIALDPALQSDVHAGDAVSVELPDGSTAAGTVSDVGTVATTSGASGAQAPGQSTAPTIDVAVSLDDPSAAGTLDQAPVQVNITTQTATDVLAVPVEALVSLLEGGYAVEVVSGGARHYVGVSLGLFADGWVEVSGRGISAGDTVVVPQ